MNFIAPIVEGQGEVLAVPGLLQRVAASVCGGVALRVNQPIRVKSGSFLNDDGYFTKMVALASAKAAQENGSVLILLDCDDDCPAVLAPSLLAKALAVRAGIVMAVALAHREYETWFLASANSLRGIAGLPNDLGPPNDPTAIRDAKGWLGQRMLAGYDPIIHQREMTRAFDLTEARTNRSFMHLYTTMQFLLEQD